jgi:alpha-tubulin suppressor-like RCC1 family protein
VKKTPFQVTGLTNVIKIAAGSDHSLALKDDGTVWAWGDDGRGQLGNDEKREDQPTPMPVIGLTDVMAIAAGQFHSLALKSDATVWAWGMDQFGQLGDNTSKQDKPTPVPVDRINIGP